jgi:hypothetical protein
MGASVPRRRSLLTYPQYLFIMEGDTPTFLGLINNGWQVIETPAGVDGEDAHCPQPSGESRPIIYGLRAGIHTPEVPIREIR